MPESLKHMRDEQIVRFCKESNLSFLSKMFLMMYKRKKKCYSCGKKFEDYRQMHHIEFASKSRSMSRISDMLKSFHAEKVNEYCSNCSKFTEQYFIREIMFFPRYLMVVIKMSDQSAIEGL